MKKYAYLARLEALLAELPEQERDDALAYYEEYIDAAGKEKEAQTIAALGSPEEVAQKILEGEGLTEAAAAVGGAAPAAPAAPQAEPNAAAATAGETASAADAATKETDASPAEAAAEDGTAAPDDAGAAEAAGDTDAAPQNAAAPAAPQQPAAPEPPPAFADGEAAPASYTPGNESTEKDFHPFQNPPKPFSRRGWIIFVCVIAAALVIQLAVLGLHFAGRGSRVAWDEVTIVEPGESTSHHTVTDHGTSSVPNEAAPGDTTSGTAQYEDHATDHGTDHGTAAAYAPVDNADSMISLYDEDVQEIELHITSANLYIDHDDSIPDQMHLEISGLDADDFETSYRTDDGRRRLVVRDARSVSANTPAEETTVTLTLPWDFHEVEATLVTGNIVLGDLLVDDVELKTGTGNIETGVVNVGKLDLKTDTGNINVGSVTPGVGEHEIDLKTGTGDISAVVNAAETDYEYELKTQNGVVQLNGQTVKSTAQSRSGRYELEASAYTGDIDILFAP